jgi:hypothetical protein
VNLRWLLRLYPPSWRRRYGAEVAALLDEQRLSPLVCLDLVRGAFDARLRPQIAICGGERGAWATRWRPGVLAGGLLLAAAGAHAIATFPGGPGPIDLAARQGTLAKLGDIYLLDGQEVGVGPSWYVARVSARADYDGDGTRGTIAAELDGLVGTTVSLGVEEEAGGELGVYTINGQPYRTTTKGRPEWAGGPHPEPSQG